MSDLSDEFWQLMEALVNETIEPEAHERFQVLLKSNEMAQEAYLAYIDLHVGLNHAHLSPTAHPSDASAVNSNKRTKTMWWIAAMAASIIAGSIVTYVLMQSMNNQNSSVVSIASQQTAPRVTQLAGARFLTHQLDTEDTLAISQTYALREGMMALTFANRANAIIEGPAIFKVMDQNRLSMHIGDVSVYAPKGAEGFEILTPTARLVDRGTRFAVSVDELGLTRVQVIEGAVDVDRGPDATVKKVILKQGAARMYDGEKEVRIAFQQERYIDKLPDRVMSYAARPSSDGSGVDQLISVSVQRGGRIRTYPASELIGVEVVHFKAGENENNLITPRDVIDPGNGDPKIFRRTQMLSDDRLVSGVTNPGGARRPLNRQAVMHDPELPRHPNTPGLAVRFTKPVTNGPGADIVLFELQVLVQPLTGDGFHVGPLYFREGLNWHTVQNYDIDLSSPRAMMLAAYRNHIFRSRPTSLGSYLHAHSGQPKLSDAAKALAVGIDLSDLGYQPGEKAEGLFIQDDDRDRYVIDPVFIGGLPVNQVLEGSDGF